MFKCLTNRLFKCGREFKGNDGGKGCVLRALTKMEKFEGGRIEAKTCS